MPNFYLSENTNYISITGTAGSSWGNGEVTVKQETGIHPQLYFTYIKKKFGILETMRLQKNLKRIEKAFDVATQNGQTALAEKFINSLAIAGRESQMVAKGLKYFVERSDVTKYKYKIKGGHISDTQLKDYTRVIPENAQKKLNKVRDLFDGFVVFHYWNEMKEEDKKVMSDEEKQKMQQMQSQPQQPDAATLLATAEINKAQAQADKVRVDAEIAQSSEARANALAQAKIDGDAQKFMLEKFLKLEDQRIEQQKSIIEAQNTMARTLETIKNAIGAPQIIGDTNVEAYKKAADLVNQSLDM